MEDDVLKARHESEARFHDRKYSQPNTSPKHYSYGPTYRIFQRMKFLLGDVVDKSVLEYGCGNGWMTVELAALGCSLATFDISKEAVVSTKELVTKKGVASNVVVEQMAAEQLSYPDNSFDVIFGFAILHHLDLDTALSELYRVLKPGGLAIFAEPLESNPAIRLYRRVTPQYRTPDEEPIKLSSFKSKLSKFSSFDYEGFYFISLVSFLFIYIPGFSKFFDPTLKALMKVDAIIFRLFPLTKRLAWYSILRIRK